MKDPDEIEFQQLVAQAIDEALSPREMKRLQELAGGNRDRLEQLVDHSLIASLLTEEGGAESVTDLVDLISPVSEIPQAEAPVSQSKWRSAIPSAIAAAVTVALVILQSPWLKTEGDQGYLGLLVDEAGAEFAEGLGPDEVRFGAGSYQLDAGVIHFRLENGADVVMRAPAIFHLKDSFHMDLQNGGLRAVIPPSAEGFTVAAPQVHYEDLGTEFGVSVDEASGASRIHVFDGQVDAKEASSNKLLSSVTSGQSMQFADDEWKKGVAPREGEYPVPGEIGLVRWQQWQHEFVKDPSLIAFYPFTETPNPLELKNDAVGAVQAPKDASRAHGGSQDAGREKVLCCLIGTKILSV